MKKYSVLIIFLTLFSSCVKELELTPPSDLTYQGFWDTEDGARAAFTGLYTSFRGKSSTFFILGELRSDVWGGNTFESPFYVDFIESNITPTNPTISNWAGFYSNIHVLNDFITNVPTIEFSNESEKQHMLAQAHGIRAQIYYTLLKTWGKVPLTTEPQVTIDPANLSKERSSEEEVMALIKGDIEESLLLFGADNSYWNGSRNYWSKAATLALKGDVYIWSGSQLGGGNADFNMAKTALESVASNNVALVSSFSDLWGTDNEGNTEFIFSFSYELDEESNFYSNMTGRGTEVHPLFDDKGNSMSDFVTNGANRFGPSNGVLAATDDNLDTRKGETFMRLFDDGLAHPSFEPENYTGSILKKFLGTISGGSRVAVSDLPLYRYADVLLLIAEAKNNLNEDPSAEINLIRERAYGDNYNVTIHGYTNGSKVENTNAILDERLKEFIGEGKRWSDLRRAGDSYVYDNNDYIDASNGFVLLLPITANMIGRNPLLEQTVGYN